MRDPEHDRPDATPASTEGDAGATRPRRAGFSRLDGAPFPAFAPGTVWLAGAGPGAPGLLTLMAYHGLSTADVVVYDALVNDTTLGWARPDAVLEYAGKRGGKPSPRQADITLSLIAHARAGRRVLRLKGGDPFMFGRGGEECEGLIAAGVPFRIVPGVSAGLGGIAYAGIPATHRSVNQAVTFLTGHDMTGEPPGAIDWEALARASPVIVMYMAVKHLGAIAERLMAGGRPPEEPVAVVANATLPSQEIVATTLGGIAARLAEGPLPTPAVVVVGGVADLPTRLDWFVGEVARGHLG